MAITEGAIIAVNGADASSGTYTSSSFDSSGGGAILYFLVHEGAPTSYTWTDNKSTPGGQFLALETQNLTVGGGAGDLSINAMVVWSPTVGTGHTLTCTLGAARTFRYGGGVVLNGTFGSASILAATTQKAEGNGDSDTVDAGSLVTDAAAYLFHCAGNYSGQAILTPGTDWTIKSNAIGGRHFQARNEPSSGTFDPSMIIGTGAGGSTAGWVTIAAAIKETAGGGATYNAVPLLDHYYRMISG